MSSSEMSAKLRAAMESVGKIEGIKVVSKSHCAFVAFNSRESAEKAMNAMYDRFYLGERKLKLLWAKAQLQQNQQTGDDQKKKNIKQR